MIDKTVWTDAGFNQKFMAADEKHRTAPHALTDDDIVTLDLYYGNAEQARRARETALQAERAKAARQATARPTGDSRRRKDEPIDEWGKRCPMAPTPLVLFTSLIPIFRELAADLRACQARVSALEGTPIAPTPPKPKVRLRGAWEPSATYVHDEAVVRLGLLWRCSAGPTQEAPRPGAVCWRVLTEVGAGDVQP